jgi:hypothetical protein
MGSPAADLNKTRLRKITFSAKWPPRTRAEGGQVEPVLGALMERKARQLNQILFLVIIQIVGNHSKLDCAKKSCLHTRHIYIGSGCLLERQWYLLI